MKRVLFTLLAVMVAGSVAAETAKPPLKVLIIGNSFGRCVLRYTPKVVRELGYGLDIASLYIGNCSLERHMANVRAPETKPYHVTWSYDSLADQAAVPFAGHLETKQDNLKYGNIPQMLAADRWDVVTIQQNSPNSWKYKTYQPFADDLVAEIRRLAPQAEIVIQETWSYCTKDSRICDQANGGPGSWGFGQTGMFERLHAAYAKLARHTGFRVIPMGTAVQEFRRLADVKDATDDVAGSFNRGKDGEAKFFDTIHLNQSGEYLQACVWTKALFGADLLRLEWAPAEIAPARAALLREAARKASF